MNARSATAAGQRPKPRGVLGQRASPRCPRARAARRRGRRSPARARDRARRIRAGRSAPGHRARRSRRSRSARGSGTGRCCRTARPPRRGRTVRRRRSAPRSAPARGRSARASRTTRRPRSRCVEERPAPQDAEQDERDDEDDGRRPVEQPRRHGEVLDPPDAVCDERPGAIRARTSITARSASGWWSSSSNRPGRFAVKGIRTGFPAVTGFSMS